MTYVIHGFFSFLASTMFGIIFNSPRNRLLHCGFVGAVGWLGYLASRDLLLDGDAVKASFLGAFTVAVVAHLFSKWYRTPMIIFSVAGIIPLVPGGTAYNTMRNVMEKNYDAATVHAMEVLMISGSIAMGLVFAEVIIQLIFKKRNKA
ncbi:MULTISPECIES: threonine/serine exporter family protein [Bhargavaea]|uniref:Threonine/serine exporter family protein n=1 Tax=Bhargavaea changchunensis TaxID=2134037 RepID=A0ABW2NH80_9BACL|nr:threonine/serine exporter family protein [Bhargavaea sp. CC-171006]